MNCVNFESIVADLVRNQMTAAGAREQALLHSSSCRACAMRLQEEQALTQGFQELSNAMREEFVSGEIEARIAVGFRAHHVALNGAGSISAPASSVRFGRARRRYWNYAAAAGIVLAMALGIAASRFWRVELLVAPAADEDATAVLSPVVADSAPTDSLNEAPTTVKPVASTRRYRPVKRASRTRLASYRVTVESLNVMAPTDEVTTEFIPTGFSNAANVQEGGQVVRLEMPRYAMSRFGLPINEERYAEMVKADVWVGADGLARAIRFVQ